MKKIVSNTVLVFINCLITFPLLCLLIATGQYKEMKKLLLVLKN